MSRLNPPRTHSRGETWRRPPPLRFTVLPETRAPEPEGRCPSLRFVLLTKEEPRTPKTGVRACLKSPLEKGVVPNVCWSA